MAFSTTTMVRSGYLWVPRRVPMGILPALWSSGHHCYITRVTMVTLAVVIPVPSSSSSLDTDYKSTTLFLQRRLASTLHNYLSLTCFSLTFSHRPLLVP